MKAKGIFMFKGIQDRKAGEFTNKETGEVVKYDSCKVLIADEVEDGQIHERRFKLGSDSKNLANELAEYDPYTKIELTFDVTLYSANAKLVPVSFELV